MVGLKHSDPINLNGYLMKTGRRLPVKAKRYYSLVNTKLSQHEDEDASPSWEENILDVTVNFSAEKQRIVIELPDRNLTLSAPDAESLNRWGMALVNASKLKLDAYYNLDKMIGEGAYSTVRLGHEKETGQAVAVKIIDKKNCPNRDLVFLERESDLVKKIDHPNIVQTFDLFESEKEMYIVLEYMKGGMLFDVLAEEGQFTEQNASTVTREIISGLSYLHNMGIVHRDIKPENILCTNKTWPLQVKLTDFGLSNTIGGQKELLSTQVGTPHFAAPELLRNQKYGPAVDMWAVGIVLYNMLSGELPFDDEYDAGAIFRQILTKEPDFPTSKWKDVSYQAVNLLKALLTKNPDKRPSAQEVMKHPWFITKNVPDKLLRNDRSLLHSSRRLLRMESLRHPGASRLASLPKMPAAV